MEKDVIKRLKKISRGVINGTQYLDEPLHTKMIISLANFLLLNQKNINYYDLICLEPLLEFDELRRYTIRNLYHDVSIERLNAIYDALQTALTRYIKESLSDNTIEWLPNPFRNWLSQKAVFKQQLIYFLHYEFPKTYNQLAESLISKNEVPEDMDFKNIAEFTCTIS